MKTYLVSIDSDVWQFVILSKTALSAKYIAEAITKRFGEIASFENVRITPFTAKEDRYHSDTPMGASLEFELQCLTIDNDTIEFKGSIYECHNIEV